MKFKKVKWVSTILLAALLFEYSAVSTAAGSDSSSFIISCIFSNSR